MPFADVQLSDGHLMPAIAFGSGSVNKHRDIHEYIENALEQGFSHLDTAQCSCLQLYFVPLLTRLFSLWQ